MAERERVDDLVARAVVLLDRLREEVGRIGGAERVPAGAPLFDQIDATRSSALRVRRRPAY